MCELFAMSSRQAATVNFSLEEFSRHGGLTGPHKDGWGIVFFEDDDVRIIKDTTPASTSPWVRFLEDHPLRSQIVISHIRKATLGELSLKNTQPFTRELGGRQHVFVHNGHIPGIQDPKSFELGFYRPLGTTDSETAFCVLLGRLQHLWLASDWPPTSAARVEVLRSFARDITSLGLANFIYSDGELLVAHGHRRRQEDGEFGPPGLHMLIRECPHSDRSFETTGLTVAPLDQRVALFASVPLTDEPWRPLAEGEVLAVKDGETL
ncbi:class II glutamine amidotransferase [Pelagibius litoralis]|uniref:Class II glutamine amidotransferase n=1 Tax=Pelagibius litoralis TaxID=374515 RepID=A0A967KIQ5_9PROT|nr:class II glutamine amidotransferase [Pelagibius litoralis]NIA72541.1 class II glutamine amidotransferase [Pelagibius litoralis]